MTVFRFRFLLDDRSRGAELTLQEARALDTALRDVSASLEGRGDSLHYVYVVCADQEAAAGSAVPVGLETAARIRPLLPDGVVLGLVDPQLGCVEDLSALAFTPTAGGSLSMQRAVLGWIRNGCQQKSCTCGGVPFPPAEGLVNYEPVWRFPEVHAWLRKHGIPIHRDWDTLTFPSRDESEIISGILHSHDMWRRLAAELNNEEKPS